MPKAQFEIFQDATGEYRFRLRAPNGEIIAHSEGYRSKDGCKNGIESVRENAPKAIIQDVRAGPFAFEGKTQLGMLDIGVLKIERALARAKQNKIIALGEIIEVETEVNQALALLNDCPTPDPGWLSPATPLFALLVGPIAHPYLYLVGGFGSCDHYPRNAEIAEDNTKGHLDYIKEIRSEVNRVKNYINTCCSSSGLSDSDKSSLHNTLSNLMNRTNAEADEFDRFIDDIERFLEEYKECIRNRP